MPKYFSIKNNAPKWSRINRDYPLVSHVYISKSHVLHGLSPYASDVEDGNGIALCDVGDFYAIDVGRVYNDPSLTYSDAPTIIPETRYSHKSIKAQAEEDRFVRSADNPDRLRGPQCHWFIADELASWRYGTEAWDMLMFGFRLGDHSQGAVATTPKNKGALSIWGRT